MNSLPFNWFDIAVLLVLAIGLQRGRKHGMSEELLPMLKWILIVISCAFLYRPLAGLIHDLSVFSLFTSNLVAYGLIAAAVVGAFALVKKSLGGKLLGSDVFGQGEYYLGMAAGMVRFACILLVTLAVLNARYYSTAEIQAAEKYQQDVYGSDFFPTLYSVQGQVFRGSFLGPKISEYLHFLLIRGEQPERRELKRKQLDLP